MNKFKAYCWPRNKDLTVNWEVAPFMIYSDRFTHVDNFRIHVEERLEKLFVKMNRHVEITEVIETLLIRQGEKLTWKELKK